MPSATASGADTGANGSARARDHNPGNQERKYTIEQKAAVLRIRRCSPTAFYEILELESVKKACSEADIKKAYRKQSLLTHPDKNGHEHADEAFKMVSRAFGVLGDKEKREKFDRFGTDPDSRFESARQQNPFSGFGGRAASGGGGGGGGGGPFGGGGNNWDDEISPEEMFQRFFGGGFGGPFGGFDTGPQFVFNIGGQRGFRVHPMGGARPRQRPRTQDANGQQQPQTARDTLVSLLPILFLFIFPLLSSLFSSGDSQPAMPQVVFGQKDPPKTLERVIPKHNIKYFVNPAEVADWTDYKLKQLDKEAFVIYVVTTRSHCEREVREKEDLHYQAQGWFIQDPKKMDIARNHPMPNCKRLAEMNIGR